MSKFYFYTIKYKTFVIVLNTIFIRTTKMVKIKWFLNLKKKKSGLLSAVCVVTDIFFFKAEKTANKEIFFKLSKKQQKNSSCVIYDLICCSMTHAPMALC